MTQRQYVTYVDELMADGGVHRAYADGRAEWRWRGEAGRVRWRDERGRSGVDEALSPKILKRTYDDDGQVVYARELGYGRTVWGPGTVVTVNRTSFGGRVGMFLAGVGAGALLGPVLLPPQTLTTAQEEMIREQARAQAQASSSGSGGGGGDSGAGYWGDGCWGDGDDFSDGDFG